MTIAEALRAVKSVYVAADALPVMHTVAAVLAKNADAQLANYSIGKPTDYDVGEFHLLSSIEDLPVQDGSADSDDGQAEAVYFKLDAAGSGVLTATHPSLFFSFLTHLLRDVCDWDVAAVANGKLFRTAFSWHRSTYDFFLTQEGRIQRQLDRESHIRHLAESGFTHLEVNGLAFPEGVETGPAGEAYPMFYTYCPALDQFVSSELNKGLYPQDYLSANLEYLKSNAELARKYGLVPGLLCFEPRNVPEEFFDRYPMLRGARVDHPFRSFKPRYNMTIAHPLVRQHYAEMLQKLLREVPDLGFLSIWTNDSGAGFEHTQSLYVGRNGGPYLVREWKSEAEIAQVAGENATRFFAVLRNAARESNPEFRVITRMESFYGEHDVIWRCLEDGLDVEAASLVMRGWDTPYSHPSYPDTASMGAGTVYQMAFDDRESDQAADLRGRQSLAHFCIATGPHTVFAPLVGVPYPSLTYKRLKLLHDNGVTHLAHLGGSAPPELVPFNVNHEILRRFQFDPQMDLEGTLTQIATKWVGDEFAAALQRAWELTEQAIMAFPHVTPLYSTMGFVWYRLWARPLVPNIEAIAESDRAYYQDFMCTTPHNPNNVDLSRDVLFQLTTAADSRQSLERIDWHVWQPIDAAIDQLAGLSERAVDLLGDGNAIADVLVRLKALRCWFMTQRNVAAWIVGVCGYMDAVSGVEKKKCRAILDEMIAKELENSEQLLELLDSEVEFMATTDLTETPLIHGRNMRQLLARRMALMVKHRTDEPFIDPGYIERQAAKVHELA
ncbi:MAG: hypothetical protein JSW51_00375 [Gemmatimonadota bacterium]|nr:MAG: hypothetical protein JSW51_00375 [Gemmatimonadota bacterium]